MKRRSISWFATDKGRNFSFKAVTFAAVSTSTCYFLCHTTLLDKYKDLVQMYGLGVGVPVSAKVKRLFEQVMDDMDASEKVRKYIKPFTVFGFDMFHAGCTQTKTGAIIGIPSNFNYETTYNVNKQHILVNLDQVGWNSDAGKSLLDALVLSEDAKKFAIGREISYVQTLYIYYYSIFPALSITFTYAIASNFNRKLGLFTRPFSLRFIMYTLVGLFGFGSWAFLQDFTTVSYETSSDKEMCTLGEKYIRGGLEFYSKLIQRNIALRTLMGDKGAKLYTVTGNDQFMIRRKHLPLTMRKEFMQKQLEELQNSKDESRSTTDDKNLKIAQVTDGKMTSGT